MATGTMSSRNAWWMLAIRGIIALLFGLAVFIRPNMFSNFVYLFGIYALVDGLVAAGSSLDERSTNSRWWMVLLEGLIGIVFGMIAMFWMHASLLYLMAIWALLMGILALVSVFTMQGNFWHEWTMMISGMASVVLGILFIIFASKGVMPLLPLMGTFAIVFGVMMVARAVQFKSSMGITSPAATA